MEGGDPFLMSSDGISVGRHVTVYKNGKLVNPKKLYVPYDWAHDEFLNAASKRLELVPTAKRVFNADGVEIDDIAMVEDNDILFVSQGEAFKEPRKSRRDGSSEGFIGGYTVGRSLGQGGFGTVRLGTHQVTGETVALKFLKKSAMGSTSAAERVVTEIQCLTEIRHPNVIELKQVLNEPQHVVLVLEYADGGDLRGELLSKEEGHMNEAEARGVFRQILSGVSYAHNHHITHRDLKLENILLSGAAKDIKITDFGLSQFCKPGELNKSSAGSLSYLPPEVLRGSSNAGPPIDVWGLGVILFALLFGELPFRSLNEAAGEREAENEIRQRIMRVDYVFPPGIVVSPEAKDLVRQMLQGNPDTRATIPQIFSHPWLLNSSTPHSGYQFSRPFPRATGSSPRFKAISPTEPTAAGSAAAGHAAGGAAVPASSSAHNLTDAANGEDNGPSSAQTPPGAGEGEQESDEPTDDMEPPEVEGGLSDDNDGEERGVTFLSGARRRNARSRARPNQVGSSIRRSVSPWRPRSTTSLEVTRGRANTSVGPTSVAQAHHATPSPISSDRSITVGVSTVVPTASAAPTGAMTPSAGRPRRSSDMEEVTVGTMNLALKQRPLNAAMASSVSERQGALGSARRRRPDMPQQGSYRTSVQTSTRNRRRSFVEGTETHQSGVPEGAVEPPVTDRPVDHVLESEKPHGLSHGTPGSPISDLQASHPLLVPRSLHSPVNRRLSNVIAADGLARSASTPTQSQMTAMSTVPSTPHATSQPSLVVAAPTVSPDGATAHTLKVDTLHPRDVLDDALLTEGDVHKTDAKPSSRPLSSMRVRRTSMLTETGDNAPSGPASAPAAAPSSGLNSHTPMGSSAVPTRAKRFGRSLLSGETGDQAGLPAD